LTLLAKHPRSAAVVFETHADHLKHLVATGGRARADVLGVHCACSTNLLISGDHTDHPRAEWDQLQVVVRVHPDGSEPFKALICTKWYPTAGALVDGKEIAVLYDPSDEQRECLIDYEGAISEWEADRLDSLHASGDVTDEEYRDRLAEIAERRERAGSPSLEAVAQLHA
jgi:hypothetical protein